MKYVQLKKSKATIAKYIFDIEDELTARYQQGVIIDPAEQDSWKTRIEEASFGRNTVMFGDGGHPVTLVKFPKISYADLGFGWPDATHDAFIVNSEIKHEVYMAKYLSSFVGSGANARFVSLRGLDPGTSKTFDAAHQHHSQMGPGFHTVTNIEFALMGQLSKAKNFQPRGNNSYGKDYSKTYETGTPTYIDGEGRTCRTATGSGPLSWYMYGSPFGPADLNGNTWEWCAGMRIVDGEIQIIPNNDAADNTKDLSATSALWKAIMPDGTLVEPGTPGTLKYDSSQPLTDDGATQTKGPAILRTELQNPAPPAWLNSHYDYNYGTFQTLAADAGVSVPDILTRYGLFPIDNNHGSDGLYVRNYGERLPFRGGGWAAASRAGVCAMSLSDHRANSSASLGSRGAFVI